MRVARRKFLLAAAAPALSILPQAAMLPEVLADTYPSRPVRLVVGYTAGSAPDVAARVLADWLSGSLGQQVIIENKPGAGTNIATEAVVNAPPDGYTMLWAGISNAINAMLYPSLSFDFLRDIAPVAGIVLFPLVIEAHPSVPAKSVADLVEDDAGRRDKVSAALKDSSQKNNRDHVDIIIALGMAKEGFDWIWCEHALTVGYRSSLTEIVQIIGRATRDAPGKTRARFTTWTRISAARTGSPAAPDVLARIRRCMTPIVAS